MAEKGVRRTMGARLCGRCNACCIHLAEGERPAHQRCEVLDDVGRCGDYANRPDLCRQYRCMWLLGLIPETWRPDNSGLICGIVRNDLGGIGINVTECWSGAAAARPDIVERCREIPCRVVMTEMRDGSTVLWSKDRTWIDDVRRRNPALSMPDDVKTVELIGAPAKETKA